jgi:hypothetical protein
MQDAGAIQLMAQVNDAGGIEQHRRRGLIDHARRADSDQRRMTQQACGLAQCGNVVSSTLLAHMLHHQLLHRVGFGDAWAFIRLRAAGR